MKIPSIILSALVLAATVSCGGGGGGGEAPAPVPAGITLLAGSLDNSGSVDGPGAAARFSNPEAVVAMPDGTLRVADAANAQVRRVTLTGETSTMSFAPALRVWGLAAMPDGDFITSRIFPGTSSYDMVRVNPQGAVRSLEYSWAPALASGPDGTLYFNYGNGNVVVRLRADGTLDTLASGFQSTALAVDAAGNVYSAGFDHAIRRVDPAGHVTVYAGQPGVAGFADGPLASARFDRIAALAFDSAGQLFVADATTIRRISADGQVRLFAGTPGQAQTQFGPLPGTIGGIKGMTWCAGALYATVGNAVVRISPA